MGLARISRSISSPIVTGKGKRDVSGGGLGDDGGGESVTQNQNDVDNSGAGGRSGGLSLLDGNGNYLVSRTGQAKVLTARHPGLERG